MKKATADQSNKKKLWRSILIGAGSFLVVLVVGFVGLFFYFFGGLQVEELDDEDLGINSDSCKFYKVKIISIYIL